MVHRLTATAILGGSQFRAEYRLNSDPGPVDLSAEFSRFVAGPDGAPWEKQDQCVMGAARLVRPSVKLFAEHIGVPDADGSVMPDRTISDASTRSNIVLVGVNAAF